MTSASVNCIGVSGACKPNNIQLVCRAVNQWRRDLAVEEFTDRCRKVVRNADTDGEGS